MSLIGLFSGIGGLELPFHKSGRNADLLCDISESSRAVLEARFPGVPLISDIAELKNLPENTSIVTAGFPCTDLSQAGRTAGIKGQESGLVSHVFRLVKSRNIDWLVLENVRNMLVLDKGRAMHYLTQSLESLGFRWAYRLVDSRFSGVPQRRHRVLFVASRRHDPRTVLFADEAGVPRDLSGPSDAYGFYWTEGLTGLGWAPNAVPPLKGGSGLGIPSPPAIWIPGAKNGWRVVVPSIEDAEELQGFSRGWTVPAQTGARSGGRWKLVGNAVTTGVAEWLVSRLEAPGDVIIEHGKPGRRPNRWPDAAYGSSGKITAFNASHWPQSRPYRDLLKVIDANTMMPLSNRATAGFLDRARRSRLRFNPDFIADIESHFEQTKKSNKAA